MPLGIVFAHVFPHQGTLTFLTETAMALATLHDLFVEVLKDLYSAENQLLEALPRMTKGVKPPELKAAFTQHLEITRSHVARLEQIIENLDAGPKGKKCAAMDGRIEEGTELLETKKGVEASTLVGAAQ